MHTYGVPWTQSLPIHPLVNTISLRHSKSFVSYLHKKIQEQFSCSLSIVTVWNIDLKRYEQNIDWRRVWNNISLTSSSLTKILSY